MDLSLFPAAASIVVTLGGTIQPAAARLLSVIFESPSPEGRFSLFTSRGIVLQGRKTRRTMTGRALPDAQRHDAGVRHV
jgi:hypothetical protein